MFSASTPQGLAINLESLPEASDGLFDKLRLPGAALGMRRNGACALSMNSRWTQADWQPYWQFGPVWSEVAKEPTTNCPGFRDLTVLPTARDLLSHRCINFRHGHGGDVYRLEFEKGRNSLSVAVNGPLIVDDVEIEIRAAIDGIGLACVGEDKVDEHLKSGALIRVLEDWCRPFAGFFLYYPSRRRQQAALSALMNPLRL